METRVVKKAVNRFKSTLRRLEGPARKEQGLFTGRQLGAAGGGRLAFQLDL